MASRRRDWLVERRRCRRRFGAGHDQIPRDGCSGKPVCDHLSRLYRLLTHMANPCSFRLVDGSITIGLKLGKNW